MRAEHQLHSAFVARGRPRAAAMLARAVAALWAWLASARKRRQAVKALQSCDDRMLKDIGLNRSEIEHAVQYGRYWQ